MLEMPFRCLTKLQTEHRFKLVSQWPIHSGSRILEIGWGEGDCRAMLVSIADSSGHVTERDPADLSYGTAFFDDFD